MTSLRQGQSVEIDGRLYRVISIADDVVELSDQSGARSTLPTTEIYLNLPSATTTNLAWASLAANLPETKPKDLSLHIREVLTGQRIDGNPNPRPEYRPDTKMGTREAAKVKELKEVLGIKMTTRTLQNKIRRYKAGGEAALADRRNLRKQDPFGRVRPTLRIAISQAIDDQTYKSTGSLDQLMIVIRDRLAILDPNFSGRLPTKTSMRKYLELSAKGKYPLGPATTRRSAANQPKRLNRSRPALLPGSEVQIDSSEFDILIRDDRGKARPAHLTAMIDQATRSIIGTAVRLDAMKGIDHALLLARTLVPRSLRPVDHNLIDLLVNERWRELLNDDERSLMPPPPFVRPERIVTDRGADYLSKVFRSACETLGVTITESSPRSPTDKPHIERLFERVGTGLAQYLPGFTGGSPSRRGKSVEEQELLSIYELAELFDRWCTIIYQNTIHSSLRDPLSPGVAHSPNTLLRAMREFTDDVAEPLGPSDYIALMPVDWRKIGRLGIEVEYRRYDSPALAPYREMPSPYASHSRQWPYRFDPYNPGQIWLETPEHSWIECVWMNRDALSKPFGLAIQAAARQSHATGTTLSRSEAHLLTAELVKASRAAANREAASSSRNLAARTLEPVTFPKGTITTVSAPFDGFDLESVAPVEEILDEE